MWQSSLLNAMSDRRQALQSFFSLGALATGVALTGCAPPAEQKQKTKPAATKRVPVDFNDPAQNLKAFIKLTGDLDPDVETVGWFGGTVFAVTTPDKPLMPLLGVEGFGVLRVATQPNGNFRMFNREIAFYKDPKTNVFLDQWTNPFTRETVEVSPIHNRVVNAEIAPVMKMDFDGTLVEVPFRPPWEIMGEKAFSLFEVHTAFPSPMPPQKWPRESAGKTLRISEMFQRFTTLEQLEDPGRDVPATMRHVDPHRAVAAVDAAGAGAGTPLVSLLHGPHGHGGPSAANPARAHGAALSGILPGPGRRDLGRAERLELQRLHHRTPAEAC